ncbi:hypothetical protein ACHAWO_011170 [Cyclotella atomus]|uniref:25S rRNA (uridine-N(3))-methyltransferase BMT5-like domain-containing protein n=1 Tax=Cyclotella atomus TaxID=382360 RepID=A0ABD3QLF5_9STRA
MSTKRDTSNASHPTRNIDNLYCSTITYACAKSGCTSCAYKICNFDIALDVEFTRCVPNVRPECCPRAGDATKGGVKRSCEDHDDSSVENIILGYQKGMSVLTVGDGDFTFSLAVARLVCDKGSGRVVATSYEEEATLQKVYPDFESTLKELQGHNDVDVCYQVDATRLDDTLPKSLKSAQDGRQRKYHRIIWNFPCTAISSGQDGQNSAMEENKALVRQFVCNALPYLSLNGEIVVAHKTKPPYCQWGLEVVALEGLRNNTGTDEGERRGGDKEVSAANGIEFEYKGRVVFDKCLLKPYTPRKALDRKSFPCHDACFYVFGRSKVIAGDYQPTIPIQDEKESFNSVVPVTESMIGELRALHLRLAEAKQGDRSRKRRRKK